MKYPKEIMEQRKSVLNMLSLLEHLRILTWLVTKDKHKLLISHLQCCFLFCATGN